MNQAILLWNKPSKDIPKDIPKMVYASSIKDSIINVPFEELSDREILNKNPFVTFVDNSMFMRSFLNSNNKIEEEPMHLTESLIDVMAMTYANENGRNMIYICPMNDEEIYHKGPTFYNPHNFNTLVKRTLISGMKRLSDAEVENIIFENEYGEYGERGDNLYYSDRIHQENNDSYAIKLFSTNNYLTDKQYGIYNMLHKRLGVPKKNDFDRWMGRLSNIQGQTTRKNQYKYILTRRNEYHF